MELTEESILSAEAELQARHEIRKTRERCEVHGTTEARCALRAAMQRRCACMHAHARACVQAAMVAKGLGAPRFLQPSMANRSAVWDEEADAQAESEIRRMLDGLSPASASAAPAGASASASASAV